MITPEKAAEKNDKLHAESLAAAEQFVDRVLANSYSTGRAVSIDVSDIPLKDYYLREKLIKRYQRAGWKVEHFDCQYQGESSYTFSKA